EPTLAEMRGRLDHWMTATNDLGLRPESEKMYDSDMAEYVGRGNKKDAVLVRNIELMKQWAKDGK
ncbi:MAG: sulfatase, partial [Planctomycetaceae bacterium]|nr:sulfatase [Planctomycetaceae bacterium]